MKTLTAKQKDRTKFSEPPTPVAASPAEISLGYLYAELTRVDVLVRLAVMRWRQAGRDPNDAFRGLVIGDDEAMQLASLPFAEPWGMLAADDGEMSQAAVMRQAEADRDAQDWRRLGAQQGVTPRLCRLIDAFGLDPFERDALLLCLAVSLDLRYEQLYSFLQNDINRKRPSVNLLLQLLGGTGVERLQRMRHFAADAPLIANQLLTYVQEPGGPPPSLLGQALMIDQTVATWLLGDYHPAAELGQQVKLTKPRLVDAERLLDESTRRTVLHATSLPNALLIFYGPDLTAQGLAGQVAAAAMERPLLTVQLDQLVAQEMPADQVVRRGLRDARLNQAIPFFQGWDTCLVDGDAPPHLLAMLLAHPQSVVIGGRTPWQPYGQDRPRGSRRWSLRCPTMHIGSICGDII